MLTTQGDKILDSEGHTVLLKGAAIGGWMNMENFISGYPGQEREQRAAMLEVLGKEQYELFYDRFLQYFFQESDAELFHSLGLNCLRLPFNYQHFEDDENPYVLKQSGFKHLDRVVELCAKHNIYTVLDLHAVPGGQNQDWHADSSTGVAIFWDHVDFQNRIIWLWKHIAQHYKDNHWVAGYNPLNEPADPKHTRLVSFYDRVEKEIRNIDPHHILFLDGNTYSMDFSHFTRAIPNSVYAIHDYATMGFPIGDRYKGTQAQKDQLKRSLQRKIGFMKQHNVPIWNGEFGPVYATEEREGPEWREINKEREELLGQQLKMYREEGISWSIWLYKDIGLQGMVYTAPDSAYNQLIEPILKSKQLLMLDKWGTPESDLVSKPIGELCAVIDKYAPQVSKVYPKQWTTKIKLQRRILETVVADSFCHQYATLFAGKSNQEIDSLMKCFALQSDGGSALQRDGLNRILQHDAALSNGATNGTSNGI